MSSQMDTEFSSLYALPDLIPAHLGLLQGCFKSALGGLKYVCDWGARANNLFHHINLHHIVQILNCISPYSTIQGEFVII